MAAMRRSEFSFDTFFVHRISTLINIYSERQIITAVYIYIYIYIYKYIKPSYVAEIYTI